MSGFILTPGDLRRRTGASASRGRVEEQYLGSWLAWLATAMRTIGTRRYLAEMDSRMLQDIGVTRSEALVEASRAPWDLGQPRHRQ